MTGGSTIHFGIDLGTTTSAIAMRHGADARIVRNNEGRPTTPSAVWVDRRGQVHVGRKAADRQETDPDNTCLEFKARMGTDGPAKRLAGIAMTPSLLSAQVLRSLRVDVGQRLGEPPDSAVITVPAGYGPRARDATRRAARLAGFRWAPLLPEPVAAAHAHLPSDTPDDAVWLVYDLGGSFNATLLRLRHGRICVLRRTGDPRLSGAAIDRRILSERLIPAAVADHPDLAGLSPGRPGWSTAIATLRAAAERAKIALSHHDTVDIAVELIDDRHRRHALRTELSRAELERLAEPLVSRSIDLCREVMRDTGTGHHDITRLILAGGQATMPFVRDRLADPRHGLGIEPATGADPLTVVARGAALFSADVAQGFR